MLGLISLLQTFTYKMKEHEHALHCSIRKINVQSNHVVYCTCEFSFMVCHTQIHVCKKGHTKHTSIYI